MRHRKDQPCKQKKNGTVVEKKKCGVFTPRHKGTLQGQRKNQFPPEKGMHAVNGEGEAESRRSKSMSDWMRKSQKFFEGGADSFAVHAEMNGRKNEAPMRTEHMNGSERKLSFESQEGEYRSGDENGTCQGSDHEQKEKKVQQESDGAGDVVPAFAQFFVPHAVQPYMRQEQQRHKDAEAFMHDIFSVGGSHKQEKQQKQGYVREEFCGRVHFDSP